MYHSNQLHTLDLYPTLEFHTPNIQARNVAAGKLVPQERTSAINGKILKISIMLYALEKKSRFRGAANKRKTNSSVNHTPNTHSDTVQKSVGSKIRSCLSSHWRRSQIRSMPMVELKASAQFQTSVLLAEPKLRPMP